MNKGIKKHKGFTLIELMIALAIISILAITVILVINPANLLREARDSQRLADLNQMNKAMSLYIANVGSIPTAICPASPSAGVATTCYAEWKSGLLNSQGFAGFGDAVRCGQRYVRTGSVASEVPPYPPQVPLSRNFTTVTSTSQAINGGGWIPLDLTAISIGVPISAWPMDPKPVVNLNTGADPDSVSVDSSYYYSFACYDGAWEFTANMESARFSSSTTGVIGDDVESTDNGTTAILYEVGTNVGL